MQRYSIWLVLVFVFLLEGTLIQWLLQLLVDPRVGMSSHFVLVIIIYFAIFRTRYEALGFGLIFGLLQDMIYFGHLIGIHAFSMGMTGYLTGLLFSKFRYSFFYCLLIMAAGLFFNETMVYGIYRMFNVVREPFSWALVHHMVPSLVLNLLIALAIFVPIRKWMEALDKQADSDDN